VPEMPWGEERQEHPFEAVVDGLQQYQIRRPVRAVTLPSIMRRPLRKEWPLDWWALLATSRHRHATLSDAASGSPTSNLPRIA